jgi:phage-related protein
MMHVSPKDKPLVWLGGEVKTPPFSADARIEAGFLLPELQAGQLLGMPHSGPMPSMAPNCHELRIPDAGVTWRIIYRVDDDAVVIAEVFSKKQQATPVRVIRVNRDRLRWYDAIMGGGS